MQKVAALLFIFAATQTTANPVSRVVELLNGFAMKVGHEQKADTELCEKYRCWAVNLMNAKSASNQKAGARIAELEGFIAEIEGGKIEFTTERVDLEKDLKRQKADIAAMVDQRDRQNKDFLAAKTEMEEAITALETAMSIIREATEGHEDAFVALNNKGFMARAADAGALERAVELGQRFLSPGDARFLQRVLTGAVPSHENPDWKKLNKKSQWHEKYKARSTSIMQHLGELLETFKSNLEEATAQEEDQVEKYDALKGAKDDELAATEQAYATLAEENGARTMNKDEANAEITELKEQVANDEALIKTTQASLDEKMGDCDQRKTVRTAELAAIQKAISILHNDDARDLFKRSFTSQEGATFLQENTVFAKAATALRSTAHATKDGRLLMLASMTSKGEFDDVTKAIDSMVAMLLTEENEDISIKDECEKDRMDHARFAATTARSMDEQTETARRLKAEIAKIVKEVETKEAHVEKIKGELKEATDIRNEEHAAWVAEDKDDRDAHTTVGNAKVVLEEFYAAHASFLQASQPSTPPPPPEMPKEDYMGKQGEGAGIIAILQMVMQDIERDITLAQANEDKAQSEYDGFKEASDAQIGTLAGAIDELNGVKIEKSTSLTEARNSRALLHTNLQGTLQTIHDAEPRCGFMLVNFLPRSKNRQIEIDGLHKAKAILQGASFDEPSEEEMAAERLRSAHERSRAAAKPPAQVEFVGK